MDKEQFKAMQAPLKEKYQRDPDAALLTLRAVGRASADLGFTVDTHEGPVGAGLHLSAGGDGTLAAAEEMLLETLVACSGVTLQAVATAFGIVLREARIVAEGDIDVRGTLAISKDVPVGFREIRLRFELDSDAPDEKLDKLIEATERYCVVLQTLRQPTEIRSTRVQLTAASSSEPGRKQCHGLARCSTGRSRLSGSYLVLTARRRS
jgi:uncharacterized OsmC-like protein